MSKRASKTATAEENVQTSVESQEPEYICEWMRIITCAGCGQKWEQVNYGMGAKTTGVGQSLGIPGVCSSDAEATNRPRPVLFADDWTPHNCPTCEAARLAAEERDRRLGLYLNDQPPERVTVIFEPDQAVLVLDSIEELDKAAIAKLGKVDIAIGSPLETLRAALGEEHFARLLGEGKIVSTGEVQYGN